MSATAVDGHGELVEQLDLLVREAVRRQGVDPQHDAPVVRRIAEGVVRDHDERSLTGAVSPVSDAAAVVGELVARVSGFGPLQPFLDDPAVEEVWINDPSRVFVARAGRHELTTTGWSGRALEPGPSGACQHAPGTARHQGAVASARVGG